MVTSLQAVTQPPSIIHQYIHALRYPKKKRTHSLPSSLQLDLWRIMTQNLHDRLPRPLTHNRTNVPRIPNLPNTLGRLRQISNVSPRLRLKQPDPPVVPARHEEVLVELEGGYRRVVGGYALEDRVGFEGECYDAAVRASCRQGCG